MTLISTSLVASFPFRRQRASSQPHQHQTHSNDDSNQTNTTTTTPPPLPNLPPHLAHLQSKSNIPSQTHSHSLSPVSSDPILLPPDMTERGRERRTSMDFTKLGAVMAKVRSRGKSHDPSHSTSTKSSQTIPKSLESKSKSHSSKHSSPSIFSFHHQSPSNHPQFLDLNLPLTQTSTSDPTSSPHLLQHSLLSSQSLNPSLYHHSNPLTPSHLTPSFIHPLSNHTPSTPQSLSSPSSSPLSTIFPSTSLTPHVDHHSSVALAKDGLSDQTGQSAVHITACHLGLIFSPTCALYQSIHSLEPCSFSRQTNSAFCLYITITVHLYM